MRVWRFLHDRIGEEGVGRWDKRREVFGIKRGFVREGLGRGEVVVQCRVVVHRHWDVSEGRSTTQMDGTAESRVAKTTDCEIGTEGEKGVDGQ